MRNLHNPIKKIALSGKPGEELDARSGARVKTSLRENYLNMKSKSLNEWL